MGISDLIQLLMLIASTAAIIVSAILSRQSIKASMDMVREQNQIQMFAEYTRRYQDIIMNMPKSVYEGDKTLDKNILRYMSLYFNLCSEEYDLYTKGAISSDVWAKWLTGFKVTMQRPIYQLAWKHDSGNYDDNFRAFFEGIVNH
jgi:hypothetical protein